MFHTLFSLGYLNPGALALLQEQVAKGALILDIRLVAASRWRPEFSGKRLRERFGPSYQRLPELGNDNYQQQSMPIVLHNPDRGIPQLLALLKQQDVCLLCRCQQFATCHASVVVAKIQCSNPAIHVIRLGEKTKR